MALRTYQVDNWMASHVGSHSPQHVIAEQKRDMDKCSRGSDKVPGQADSAELLEFCLHFQQEAWTEFVRRFQPLIASVIVKTLRRCVYPYRSLVDDLVQETYLKLCANNAKALREFDCRHKFALEGFLKVVASNVTQDYLRSSLCRKRGSGKGEDDLEPAKVRNECQSSSAESIEHEILLRQIQQCLQRECAAENLERDCRIFWLYYRCGLTARAISRRCDIGLSTKGVESALFRLTQVLKAKLGRPLSHKHRSTRKFVTSVSRSRRTETASTLRQEC